MTEEEFKKQVVFRQSKNDRGIVRVTAGFWLEASGNIDTLVHGYDRAMEELKANLVAHLLRRVYEDRRKELHGALLDFRMAHPASKEYHEAFDKVMRIAKWQ